MVELSYRTWLEVFSAFLMRRGIYELFVQKLCSTRYSLERYVSAMKGRPFEMISKAFTWRDTREGFVFWDKVDTEWRGLVDKLI